MEVWNPEHPHHAVWREYTQSLLDGKPKVVQVYFPKGLEWVRSDCTAWFLDCKYRIARPTLTLTYTVPMPVTEALEFDDEYWFVSSDAFRSRWTDDPHDVRRLGDGLIYLTREDAQAAIDARAAAMRAALETLP